MDETLAPIMSRVENKSEGVHEQRRRAYANDSSVYRLHPDAHRRVNAHTYFNSAYPSFPSHAATGAFRRLVKMRFGMDLQLYVAVIGLRTQTQ